MVVPRLAFDVAAHGLADSPVRLWGNTAVAIPEDLAGRHYRDALTGETVLSKRRSIWRQQRGG